MRKTYWIIAVLFIGIYFASRLVNLTDLPIFTDEAIYIRWAQIGGRDAAHRFISLTDGKQPLFVWFTMVTLRLFSDPLFAGRVVSAVSGLGSLFGIGLLTWEFFRKKRAAVLASLLYLTSPFALMYDRMALMDSMVAMFSIWSLYFAVLLVRTVRLDVALIFGMVLGGGVLTKTSGFLNIYLLPATLLLFDRSKKDAKARLLRLLGLMLVAVSLSQLIYSVLRLSPWFHLIHQKDGTFIFTLEEFRDQPFRFFIGNMRGMIDWIVRYMTPPILVMAIGSLYWTGDKLRKSTLILFWSPLLYAAFALYVKHFYPYVKNRTVIKYTKHIYPAFDWLTILLSVGGAVFALIHREWKKIVLGIWFVVPFLGLAIFGKVLYPRFVLFMVMPLLVLAAWGIDRVLAQVRSRFMQAIVLIVLLAMPLYADVKILFSIVTAPIPRSDADQYINDWPSGWGIREVVDFIRRESAIGPVAVYTDGTFGLLPYAIEIYLVDKPNIEIIGIWPIREEMTDHMRDRIAEKPTYMVLNRDQALPKNWLATEIAAYQKGSNQKVYLRLYQLHGEKRIPETPPHTSPL